MPNITIDGSKFEFQQGQTIIQVAEDNGIDIPHFCWHKGLSVSGNCRICLVEVEKSPKLVIACSTQAAEGMVVHTKSQRTKEAQNAVMEFLLINHPLDCPICDEAGECKLQDYAYKYSTGVSRFDEEKNKKDKRVELGPNVMFDGDRCISCSRCIRFCEEIAKNPQLTFVQRGEKVTIKTFPGKKLDNPYSMNVIEICPVGALTSKHFRFRSRVWDMSFTDSVCIGCSRGCNTILGVRNNEILRIEPRENLNVNDYWLCDYGRLNTFKFVNDKSTRIKGPNILINVDNKNEMIEVDWDEAISKAVYELINKDKDILFVASPYSTLEDMYALKKFASEIFHSGNIIYFPDVDESFEDDLLRKKDKTPNSNGLNLFGFKEAGEKDIESLSSGKYHIIYIINDDLTRIEGFEKIINNSDFVIQHLHSKNSISAKSNVILSESSYAEVNGTFLNFNNIIQRVHPAVATLEQERLLGEFSLSRLDKFGAPNDRWTHGIKFNARPTWKILKHIAKVLGHDWLFENSEEVFTEFCEKILDLKNYDYEKVGSQGLKI
jgi:NADH-quinone oxidoreductase subunit G